MRFSWLVALFCLTACQKKDAVSVQILGHAGMGLSSNTANCPGNSQMAIDLALALDEVDGMELDVRFSIDTTAWFVHDSELSSQTNLSGCVEQKSDQELQNGRYKGGGNHRLVSLKKDAKLWEAGKRILLDIKHFNACDQLFIPAEVIDKVLESLGLKNNPNVYLLFNQESYLTYFHDKGWKVMYSSDDKEKFQSVLQNHSQLFGFLVRKDVLSNSELRSFQEKGIWVYLYEIRSNKENKMVRESMPTGILSDDVYGSIIELR